MTRAGSSRRLAFVGLVSVSLAAVFVGGPADAGLRTHTCFGQALTQPAGTSADDTFLTTDGQQDVIYGGGGNDTIVSLGEDGVADQVPDYLCGGPGADYIRGHDGPDLIRGGAGADVVEGWRGTDLVQGNRGADKVSDDSIYSNDAANDTLRGGAGHDTVLGGWGADVLYGGRGPDRLFDQECDGPTVVHGGLGADYMDSYRSSYEGWTTSYCDDRSGATPDHLTGGKGRDRARASLADVVHKVESLHRIRGVN